MTDSRARGRTPVLPTILTVIGMLVPLAASLTAPAVGAALQQPVMIGGLVAMWAFAAAVFWLLRSSSDQGGIRPARFGWADLGIAVGVGVAGALLVPVLTLGATALLGETGLGAVATSVPVLLLVASILTAAVTEEVLYRAAPIELLRRRGAPGWVLFVVPWAAFVVAHLGSWNLAHVVGVVVPLGALLAWLYLWRRNLLVNIIAHAIIDAPLIVIALTAS